MTLWFVIIRLVFWILISVVLFYRIRITNISNKKRIIIISSIAILIAYMISGFILIENLFVTFPTPESAFKYKQFGEIKLTVNGDTTTMILSENKDADSYTIYPKTDKGWKLGTVFEQKKILTKQIGFKLIFVYNYKGTSDYYVIIWDVSKTEKIDNIKISDNKDSTFHNFSNNTENKSSKYVTYVSNYGDDYELSINGEVVNLQ